MHHLNRPEGNITNLKRLQINSFKVYFGYTGIFLFGKYIGKLSFKRFLYSGSCVNINGRFLPVVKSPDIVHAGNMVLVFMGKNNGIEVLNFCTKHLISEIGSRVDHDHFTLGFYHDR